jgi:hypothetical protein
VGWLIPVEKILDTFVDWIAETILTCFEAIFAAITRVLLITPDVTGLPQVQALTGRATWIVDTVFVLAFVAAGVLVMVAGGDERSRYTVKDLAPRLVVGFVSAHFSQLLCGLAISLANGLTQSLSEPTYDSDGALDAINTQVRAAADSQLPALLFAVIALLITVLLAMTAFSLIVRLATLLVLTAAAPLALACHALPHTDPVARLWWRGYAGCLATPVLQAMTLQAGQWMLLDPRHMLPTLGLPHDPGTLLNLFIVMVLLWYTVKIPGIVSRYVAQGGRSTSFVGTVVRVVIVQQLAKAVRIPGLSRSARVVTG